MKSQIDVNFRNSKCGGMATHAGLALELGIVRKKSLSPQMEAIMIWCQCRTREYDDVNIQVTKIVHGIPKVTHCSHKTKRIINHHEDFTFSTQIPIILHNIISTLSICHFMQRMKNSD